MSVLNTYKKSIQNSWGQSPDLVFGKRNLQLADHVGTDLVSETGYYLHVTDQFEIVGGHVSDKNKQIILPRVTKELQLLNDEVHKRILKVRSLHYIPKNAVTRKHAQTNFATLITALEHCRFAHRYEAKLLLAWCVLAPYASTLEYRPHLWLNGLSHSGKTWLINKVVHPLLKDLGQIQSGLETQVIANPQPLVIDEFESKLPARKKTRDEVIEYLRIASTSIADAPMALLSSVVAPRLDEVNQARFININLKKNKWTEFQRVKQWLESDKWHYLQTMFLDYTFSVKDDLKKQIKYNEDLLFNQFDLDHHILKGIAALQGTLQMYNQSLSQEELETLVKDFKSRLIKEDDRAIAHLLHTSFPKGDGSVTIHKMALSIINENCGRAELFQYLGASVIYMAGKPCVKVDLNNQTVIYKIMAHYSQEVSNWRQIIKASDRVICLDKNTVIIRGVLDGVGRDIPKDIDK